MAGFTKLEAQELASQAHVRLKEFLATGYHNEDEWVPARITSSILSSCMKFFQTDSAREATRVLVARELTQGDPSQFAKYIRVSMPDAPFISLLDAPAKIKKKTNRAKTS